MQPEPSTVPPSLPTKSSLTARLLNVFAAPGEVFDEVKASPTNFTNWLVPLLLQCLVSVVFVLVVFSQPVFQHQILDKQDQAMEKQVQAGKMTREQAEQAKQFMGKLGPTMMIVGGSVGAVGGAAAMLFAFGLVVWCVGRWALKGNLDYMKAVEVVGLSSMVTLLGGLVTLFLVILMGSLLANPGPMLLVKDFSPENKLHLALASLNLITIWYTALVAFGVAKVTGASFMKAAAWFYGLWIVLRAVIIFSGMGAQGM